MKILTTYKRLKSDTTNDYGIQFTQTYYSDNQSEIDGLEKMFSATVSSGTVVDLKLGGEEE